MRKTAATSDSFNWKASASVLQSLLESGAAMGTIYSLLARLLRRSKKRARHNLEPAKGLIEPAEVADSVVARWLAERRAEAPPPYALCMGISDYSPFGIAAQNLPWCADDARRVAAALDVGGAVVECLTDRAATTAAVADWISRVAAECRAHPASAVWLFYSGHGVRSRPSPANADEADLRQDAILLADGPLADDELARLLALLPKTTTVVVALDSCHSGGLLLEVLRRGGPTLFMASSDEDATSEVAAEYATGGYLSFSLIRALGEVGGGPVTAGGLQDAILGGWATHCGHKRSVYEVLGKTTLGRQWPTVLRTCPRDAVLAGHA